MRLRELLKARPAFERFFLLPFFHKKRSWENRLGMRVLHTCSILDQCWWEFKPLSIIDRQWYFFCQPDLSWFPRLSLSYRIVMFNSSNTTYCRRHSIAYLFLLAVWILHTLYLDHNLNILRRLLFPAVSLAL